MGQNRVTKMVLDNITLSMVSINILPIRCDISFMCTNSQLFNFSYLHFPPLFSLLFCVTTSLNKIFKCYTLLFHTMSLLLLWWCDGPPLLRLLPVCCCIGMYIVDRCRYRRRHCHYHHHIIIPVRVSYYSTTYHRVSPCYSPLLTPTFSTSTILAAAGAGAKHISTPIWYTYMSVRTLYNSLV